MSFNFGTGISIDFLPKSKRVTEQSKNWIKQVLLWFFLRRGKSITGNFVVIARYNFAIIYRQAAVKMDQLLSSTLLYFLHMCVEKLLFSKHLLSSFWVLFVKHLVFTQYVLLPQKTPPQKGFRQGITRKGSSRALLNFAYTGKGRI